LDVHTFCPLIRHVLPSRTPRVRTPARSEPASGSENSWQPMVSPRCIGAACAASCAGVPLLTIAWLTVPSPMRTGFMSGTSYCASMVR
jgi:hypothetical protein